MFWQFRKQDKRFSSVLSLLNDHNCVCVIGKMSFCGINYYALLHLVWKNIGQSVATFFLSNYPLFKNCINYDKRFF